MRVIKLVLAMTMIMAISITSVNAAELQTDSQQKVLIEKGAEQLVDKYEVLEEVISINRDDYDEILEFATIEEFESYVKNIPSITEKPLNLEISLNETDSMMNLNTMKSTVYDDIHTITWWAPCTPMSGWGGPLTQWFCWKNVAFDYTYTFVDGHPKFSSVSNVSSYLAGVNTHSWVQTGSDEDFAKKYYTGDTVEFKIQGYYILGVVIGGYPVGFTVNDTWTGISLTLTN